MPLYKYELFIPAKTPKETPVRLPAEIPEGIITKVEIHFPPGPHGWVYTRCLYGHKQLWPEPWLEGLNLDNCIVTIPEYWPLPEKPTTLTLEGWSPEADYPHTITWLFTTEPAVESPEVSLLNQIAQTIKKWLGIK